MLDLIIQNNQDFYIFTHWRNSKHYMFFFLRLIGCLLAQWSERSWLGILIVYVIILYWCCCNVFSSPHEISEPLKIWNFGNNKKVSSRREDVQQKKKIRKKVIFLPCGVILAENFRILCPPMISLNGWRYEILVKTKKFRLDE